MPSQKLGVALWLLVLASAATCAERPAGKVVWWGHDIWPSPRYPDQTNGVVESEGEVVTNIVAVAGSLGLETDGTVVQFRSGRYGWEAVPVGVSNVVSIAAEGDACWAIKRDGSVLRWGANENRDADVVVGLRNVTAIAWAGAYSYLALKNDGTVAGWRVNNNLLPDGTFPKPVARLVAGDGYILSNVVALVSGYEPLALGKDGTVLHLQYWKSGTPRPEPEVTKVEADGFTLDFGGDFAQTPYKYTSADPVKVGGQVLSNVTAIAGGDGYHVALKKDGSVLAWSEDPDGQIAEPRGLSNVTAITSSMALRRDGTVLAWGENPFGPASVPAGLSNVVAIASGGGHNLAITTGSIPASVYIYPHGRLEEMEREADLIFKGRAISSLAISNAMFPYYAKTHATRFDLISLLRGAVQTNSLIFWHMTHGPDAWGGGSMPSWHEFEPGRCYLVFAARLDRPGSLYTAPPDATNRPNEFRQLYRDGVMRTLDARPLGTRGVKEAHWAELRLLLSDAEPTNQLYAIDTLDRMSLAGRHDDRWMRTDDFRRKAVLSALLPLLTNNNESVASRALGCFAMESHAATALEPFAAALIQVAIKGPTTRLRLDAISALSGTHFASISNSLVQLLHDANGDVRARAVALLALCPAEFSEPELRRCAEDSSPKVRAAVADVIGGGTMQNLLPTLTRLFADPVGRQQPIAPLTIEEVEGGAKIVSVEGGVTMVDEPSYPGANVGDVHTSAGYALLKFDVQQVGDILKTNLNDAGFRLQFLLKLAEADPTPWINDMVKIMEARRVRNLKKAQDSHLSPGTFMYLSGAYYQCWRTLYAYLEKLPAAEFAEGKQERILQVLEQAGNTGSQEPVMLYELYKAKGLNQRAAKFRAANGNYSGYNLGEFFNRVDVKYPTNSMNLTP